ncbi:hypothetical protein OWV82_013876 [Melia azedarach]|uniref:Uncharacterized protein n=1 Tax=Melia azedarach TaxID=155640 RepID=A0ACC1XXU0_MELAZ|nr:hypothetical protein OWV82_013876 [Melia azedarach]
MKEQQKIDPPRKIVSRTEADKKLLKEQKEVDPLKKNASSGEAWQLTSKEKQVGDVKKETSYGITAGRVNNRSSGHPLEDDRKVIPKQENNENYTKKTFGSAEQEDLPFWKQKQKYVRQEGINRDDTKCWLNHTDISTSSIGNASKEQQKAVLKQDYSNEIHGDTRQESNKNYN